jgi:RNA polymerase sigma-70 factor (ECF subfamily)
LKPRNDAIADLIADRLVDALYRLAGADRWDVARAEFAAALATSAERALAGTSSDSRAVERYLRSLHLADLALACACAAGNERAWDFFVLEHRPVLYRAADALAPGGAARELADSLYADLYGLDDREGTARSLFRYFHGRSSLATWLRAVLAQRYVDRVRVARRLEPLPEEDTLRASAPTECEPSPDRRRFLAVVSRVLHAAVSRLAPRDRLRLGCYYAQELTLAETGRLMREHEATVSRNIARSRKAIRKDVEEQLRSEGLTPNEMAECLASVSEDAGTLDLRTMFGPAAERKENAENRST